MASSNILSKRTMWFTNEVNSKIVSIVANRVGIATRFVANKVLRNISIPVERITGSRGGEIVVRSRPGEFPRKDTAALKRTLITDIKRMTPNIIDGFVGSPMDYSLVLELDLSRKFLSRTLNEERGKVLDIIIKPIR